MRIPAPLQGEKAPADKNTARICPPWFSELVSSLGMPSASEAQHIHLHGGVQDLMLVKCFRVL